MNRANVCHEVANSPQRLPGGIKVELSIGQLWFLMATKLEFSLPHLPKLHIPRLNGVVKPEQNNRSVRSTLPLKQEDEKE